MELRALLTFVEVVRQGSFSRAARTLFATQSTISKTVSKLESELGVPLLGREGRGSKPTAAGEIVYAHALSMLTESELIVAELDDLRGMKRGTLRLGLPLLGSSILFASSFMTYRNRYPGIEIQLFEHGSKRLEELVLNGEIELAASLLPVDEEFEWQALCRDRLDLLISADHPLAAHKSVNLNMLRKLPFILFETGFGLNPIILEACRQSGFTPTIALRSSQIDFIIELVAARLGIAFLPRSLAKEHSHTGVHSIAIEDPGMIWDAALIWRRGGYLSPAAKAWKSVVLENVRPLPQRG